MVHNSSFVGGSTSGTDNGLGLSKLFILTVTSENNELSLSSSSVGNNELAGNPELFCKNNDLVAHSETYDQILYSNTPCIHWN